MSTYIPDNFDIGVPKPIDSRNIKETIALRDAIPSAVRLKGLEVYVVQEKIKYQLQNGITNLDWVPISGGSSDDISINDVVEFNISSPSENDILSFNSSTQLWENINPFFEMDGISSSKVKLTDNFDELSIKSKLNVRGDEFKIFKDQVQETEYTTFNWISDDFVLNSSQYGTIFKLDTSNRVVLGGNTADSLSKITLDADSTPIVSGWSTTVKGDTAGVLSGLQVKSCLDPNQSQFLVRNNDGDITSRMSYALSEISSRDLILGNTATGIGGSNNRAFSSVFDNYTFTIGNDNVIDGFLVQKVNAGENLSFKLNHQGIDVFSENGVNTSSTNIKGDLLVSASENILHGNGIGKIESSDEIKTNEHFSGNYLFNNKTNLLVDASGPNYCKIASISVNADEHSYLEIDYSIPNTDQGSNSGKLITQAWFDSDGQIVQEVTIDVEVPTDTGHIVHAGGIDILEVLNTNGGADPPFDDNDDIRIPDLSAQPLTVQLIPGLTGVTYVYTILGGFGFDLSTVIGSPILIDVTTQETVDQILPGDSFVTSFSDIKRRITGDNGINWHAVLDNSGPIKTLDIYAEMLLDDSSLHFKSSYQKDGSSVVSVFSEQPWISSIPIGTTNLEANISSESYWALNGSNLYNITGSNVGIGNPDPSYKLDVNGTISSNDGLLLKPNSSLDFTKISSSTLSALNIKLENNIEDSISISRLGNIFINSDSNTSTEAKLQVVGGTDTTYAMKVQSGGSAEIAARFAGGDGSTDAIIVTDYLGNESVNITGGGVVNSKNKLTVDNSTIFEVSNDELTYKGSDIWNDANTGSINLLEDVDLSGINSGDILVWNGVNFISTIPSDGITNLSYTESATNGTVVSDTGSNAIIPIATEVNAGLLQPEDKTKLNTIASFSNQNVQVDWNQTNNIADSYILNKPTLLSDFNDDLGISSHISSNIIHITQLERDEWSLAEENVQSNWLETNTNLDSFILNKPTLGSSAATNFDTEVTELSSNLVTSSGIFDALLDYSINPATGFTRFSDDTIRLIQGANTMNISDVPRLAPDGRVLASQSRSLIGGETTIYADQAAAETDINGGTTIPAGDFIYIQSTSVMWIADIALLGPGWVFATAVANSEILDVSTGASSYTQIQINNAFDNNSIITGDGLIGGGPLSFGGSNINLAVDVGNGLNIAIDGKLELDSIVGTPTGTIYTP